jgi:hypothetical protein
MKTLTVTFLYKLAIYIGEKAINQQVDVALASTSLFLPRAPPAFFCARMARRQQTTQRSFLLLQQCKTGKFSYRREG